MEALFTLIFIAAFIAGVIYIPYKIYKVIFVGENQNGASNGGSSTDWKCPKCGLINNREGSCLCGYDTNKPENKIDDFDSLTQTALKNALFDKNFEDLGLRPSATIDEVRERCKELVKQWHPDLHKHDADKHRYAIIKMQVVKAAYDAIVSSFPRSTSTDETLTSLLETNSLSDDEKTIIKSILIERSYKKENLNIIKNLAAEDDSSFRTLGFRPMLLLGITIAAFLFGIGLRPLLPNGSVGSVGSFQYISLRIGSGIFYALLGCSIGAVILFIRKKSKVQLTEQKKKLEKRITTLTGLLIIPVLIKLFFSPNGYIFIDIIISLSLAYVLFLRRQYAIYLIIAYATVVSFLSLVFLPGSHGNFIYSLIFYISFQLLYSIKKFGFNDMLSK